MQLINHEMNWTGEQSWQYVDLVLVLISIRQFTNWKGKIFAGGSPVLIQRAVNVDTINQGSEKMVQVDRFKVKCYPGWFWNQLRPCHRFRLGYWISLKNRFSSLLSVSMIVHAQCKTKKPSAFLTSLRVKNLVFFQTVLSKYFFKNHVERCEV